MTNVPNETAEALKETIEKLKQFPKESKEKFKQVMAELSTKVLSEELLSLVDRMTDEEYTVFLEILAETVEAGESAIYNRIRAEDYEEIPVDIRTFICDPEYLGKSTDGGTSIYPYWIKVLEKIFAPDSKIMEVVLTGAIGIGKSTVAVIGMAYTLYRLMCLKSPAEYYGLMGGSKIAEAIFNIDLQHVTGIGYGKLQATLKQSPWFIKHGILRGRTATLVTNQVLAGNEVPQAAIDELTFEPSKDITILIGSKVTHFTGYDVFCAFLDEMNFYEKGKQVPNTNESFTATEIMQVYMAIKRRMQSRFMVYGKIPGVIFMVSSKKAENEALEMYANKYRQDPTVLIVDEPIWNIKGKYSGKRFKVAVGDKYNSTRILSPDEDWALIESQGRKVLDVPEEYRKDFELDADKALTDDAGIALSSSSKYIDANKYVKCISKVRNNIFKVEVVKSGLGTADSLVPLVDLSRIPDNLRHLQVYIHLDTSKNNDRTGIGIVARSSEYRDVDRFDQGIIVRVRDYTYYVLGAMGIEAPVGDMIPYRKLLELIVHLRNAGLNIASVSTDTYQSLFLQQELLQNGFNMTTVSVDRTPVAYLAFRKSIYEERVDTITNLLLETEITELIEDKRTGKIDHPISGSKDLADGVTGAFYNASINQQKVISASELARIQEASLDAQLGRDTVLPEEFNGKKIRQNKDIFDQLDKMFNDEFDD